VTPSVTFGLLGRGAPDRAGKNTPRGLTGFLFLDGVIRLQYGTPRFAVSLTCRLASSTGAQSAMAKRKSSAIRFPVLSPSLQVDFWARLQQIRSQYLSESLAQTVRSQDIEELDRELLAIIGSERLRALAAYSLRGETFYAVPCILKAKPLLLGYYRLLYGLSQKEFYRGVFGRFRPMEQDNQLNAQNDELLPGLCRSLAQTGWTLFNGIQPVSQQVIHELQLLTVGPQLRGSRNVAIGMFRPR